MAQPKQVPVSGTLLKHSTTSGEPDTLVGNIKAWNELPSMEVDEFETTRVDQLDGEEHDWFKYFEPDHIDPGQIGVTLGLDEDQLATLYELVRDMRSWLIEFPNGATVGFEGFIKTLGQEAEERGEIVIPVTIRISGKVEFTRSA